jgi:hypothetical protein
MNRFASVLFVSLLLFTTAACSGDKKPPTQSAVKGSGIISTLRDLSHMFEKKNLPGFMNAVSDNYQDRQAFTSSLEGVFAKYETVRFTIQYTKMLIIIDEQGGTRADFNWDSEWRTTGGSVQKNGGRATFVFDHKESKLLSIDGKSPFVPQPVETPGNKP